MAKSMEIGGHGGHIKIDVQGYEQPETSDEDDANWLIARCNVAVAEFSCTIKLNHPCAAPKVLQKLKIAPISGIRPKRSGALAFAP
jgi:hypothetical protein